MSYYTVRTLSPGDKKLHVCKVVLEIIPNLGLAKAKELVESYGTVVMDVSKDEAIRIEEKLESAGAKAEIANALSP